MLAEHWIVEEGASCSYIGQDFDVSAISGCEDNWTESRIEESKAFMVARLTGDGGSGSIDQGKGDI